MGDVLRFPARIAPANKLSDAPLNAPPITGFAGIRHGSVRMALGEIELDFTPEQARYLGALLIELAAEAARGAPP